MVPAKNKRCRLKGSRFFLLLVLTLLAVMAAQPFSTHAQTTTSARKAKITATPVYPALARQLNLSATVKVQVTVSSSGAVLDAKPTGGHPMFIAPSLEAAKRWHYEPAGQNTTEVIEFHFSPGAS
jgi:TonB family protein